MGPLPSPSQGWVTKSEEPGRRATPPSGLQPDWKPTRFNSTQAPVGAKCVCSRASSTPPVGRADADVPSQLSKFPARSPTKSFFGLAARTNPCLFNSILCKATTIEAAPARSPTPLISSASIIFNPSARYPCLARTPPITSSRHRFVQVPPCLAPCSFAWLLSWTPLPTRMNRARLSPARSLAPDYYTRPDSDPASKPASLPPLYSSPPTLLPNPGPCTPRSSPASPGPPSCPPCHQMA